MSPKCEKNARKLSSVVFMDTPPTNSFEGGDSGCAFDLTSVDFASLDEVPRFLVNFFGPVEVEGSKQN